MTHLTTERFLTDDDEAALAIPADLVARLRWAERFHDLVYELTTDSRDSPPARNAPGGGAPANPAAWRTQSRDRAGKPQARRQLRIAWRRAGPFLLGAVQCAAFCLAVSTWVFLIMLLGHGMIIR